MQRNHNKFAPAWALVARFDGRVRHYIHDRKSCAECISRWFDLFPFLWDTFRRVAFDFLICITSCTAADGRVAFGKSGVFCDISATTYQTRGL